MTRDACNNSRRDIDNGLTAAELLALTYGEACEGGGSSEGPLLSMVACNGAVGEANEALNEILLSEGSDIDNDGLVNPAVISTGLLIVLETP
jgi:hypothetical protein